MGGHWHPPMILGFLARSRYFTSRPDLLSRVPVGGAGASEMQGVSPAVPPAAITAAQRALTNPATSRFLASGLQRASAANANANSVNADGSRSAPVSISPAAAASAASVAAAALPSLVSSASSSSRSPAENERENAQGLNVGRVAAAAQAFSASPSPGGANSSAPGAHKRTDSGRLVAQKVNLSPVSSFFSLHCIDWRGEERRGVAAFLTIHKSGPLLPSFFPPACLLSFFFFNAECGADAGRNLAMWTCRPPGRCSAPYVALRQRRTRLLQRCTRHPHLQARGRKR